ncbi:MAG TPA: type 2 lanthipeptide synthetase LanM family protein [Thermoanaerobaculia bacterium]|nr:type 2 lanthipeptide synthetase LanM family protein [Thermoanaerobaculia bacterium]
MSSSTAIPEDVVTLDDRARTAEELLASPRWALGWTLEERIGFRRRNPSAGANIDTDAAAKRLARWKSSGAFPRLPELWREKLDAAGIAEEELRSLLGQTEEQIAAECDAPPWLVVLAEAYGETAPPFPWPASADLQRCRFLPLLEPLVWQFSRRIETETRAILARHPAAPFTESIARVFAAHLPDQLAALLNRALVVEMHVLKLEERLHGETPEERFESFLEQLRVPEYALEILERYPVLARQAVLRLESWASAAIELLDRLAQDADAIARCFEGAAPLGQLRDVYGGLSDLHRGGRSVAILLFDSGFELVYKPKSLALEAAFQQLLGWINDRGFEPSFRLTGVLDRGEYGWMERVWTAPCENEAALRRFLERQGGFLALLYALDGTDFHHENLLACGEHPILIDLETLFQPWLNAKNLLDVESAPGAPLRNTVLRPNLLPERWYGDREHAGVDLSGLTATDGQLTPRPMLAATDSGLDSMRMERRRMHIPAGESRARVEGRDLAPEELAPWIEEGFRRMYALLMDHREALIGQLAAFAECEMRILFRTTMSYGTVMLESLHPHALGNALDRDRLFDTLWTAAVRRPYLRRLFAAESRDLHRGDIPLFVSRPGSRDALHWSGERFADFFEESGLDRVTEKVRALSGRDLERQAAVIRDTFDALRISGRAVPRPSYDLIPTAVRPQRDELLALACRAADRVIERAFENDEQAHWLALDYRDPDGWQLVPAHPDFYLGLPGIAFFLGHLGAATGEARYTEVARKALFAQRQQLAADPKLVTAAGAFNGWGGIVYTLAHLGRLWNDETLLDEAESYARALPPRIAEDDLLDVITGSAGCLLALFSLARVRPSKLVDELMIACGERLLAKAEPQSEGIGWRMPLAGDRALAGLSHGAAGIALALLRLADRTGDARYRIAAEQGIAYERSLFSASEGNWPDLRAGAVGVDGSSSHFMLAWCHGAPGIGLARVAGLPWLHDDRVREEIDVAVQSTLAKGFGENHSLCHGDLGNLELLFAAAEATCDHVLEEKAWHLAGGIVGGIHRQGWLAGLPGNIETPGLMAGLSGIGYGLARLARPDLFPRLLTLES